MDNPVLVVDFGAQYAQLIARRVREAQVYSEIVPHSMPLAEMLARNPAAIILSGGPASVYEPGAPQVDPALFTAGIPVLGICYGFQAMARALGGEVAHTGAREFGNTSVTLMPESTLFAGLPARQDVWMSHGDCVSAAPPGFAVTAASPAAPVAAFENPTERLAGVQFHPEVAHTRNGQTMLTRFLYNLAGIEPTWTKANIIEEQVAAIRAQVGDKQVICGLSGGVDSAVAAALVHEAVGDQLTCVFVDHGLLRAGEAEQVETDYVKATGIRLHVASGDARFLVQGTLYPDVVESGGGTGTANIKSHHNVGGLPDDLAFALVEPLRTLFKDEVRAIGAQLGLPDAMVWRHPFPGPGLAIRIIGAVTPDRLAILRAADRIAREELTAAGLDRSVWQFPVVLLADVRSVGVQGDGRTYGHPIVLRPVSSDDAMTADWSRLPYDVIARISTRITNEVPEVNRLVLDVTSKPPGTIEWE